MAQKPPLLPSGRCPSLTRAASSWRTPPSRLRASLRSRPYVPLRAKPDITHEPSSPSPRVTSEPVPPVAIIPPPRFRERRHRSLARSLVSMGCPADVAVVAARPKTVLPPHSTAGGDAPIDDHTRLARLLLDGDQPPALCEPDGRTRLSSADVGSFGDACHR
jgi:hypothetical protein